MTARPVIVTGAGGQVGTALLEVLPEATGLERRDLDVADRTAVRAVLADLRPSVVVNCAAYTAVDRAEEDEERATAVNGIGVGELASACRTIGARFITYSTDYVFDGSGTSPYLESDPTDPVNAYGRSKLVGEERVAEAGGDTLVIRTSWVVSGTHPNFVATMLDLVASGRELRVVNDQVGCPTVAADLAAATVDVLRNPDASGIVHMTNSGATTWFELARHAVASVGLDPASITPCTTEEYPTPAKRPAYSVLGSERRASLGIADLPPWRDSVARIAAAHADRLGLR